ncbi:MAG: 2-phosphosulfolactate phosphatase [Syntrophomonadaceae bacterium]
MVIDVIRASSTIVTLLDKGCHRVYTLAEEKPTLELAKRRGMLTSGEWQGIKLKGFDMENSPAEVLDFPVQGREVALCTSNGTRVIETARGCLELFIGCLLNAQACVRAALVTAQAAQSEITLVCAGQYGRFVLDDAYCAGYLLREMEIQAQRLGIGLRFTDASKAVRALTVAYPDARTAFRESASGQRLLEIGGEKDFEFCLQTNTSPVVPHMKLDQDLIWFADWGN